jgi:transposase
MAKKHPHNRADDNIRLAVFNAYVEGKSIAQACRELGISKNTAQNWKEANWPEHWENAKAKRIEEKQKLAQSVAMETYEQIQARIQRTHRAVSNALAGQIVRKAQQDKVPDDVAADLFIKTTEAEIKIHLPPEQQGPQSRTAMMGGMIKPTGELGIFAMMNETFEKVNGPDKPDKTDT